MRMHFTHTALICSLAFAVSLPRHSKKAVALTFSQNLSYLASLRCPKCPLWRLLGLYSPLKPVPLEDPGPMTSKSFPCVLLIKLLLVSFLSQGHTESSSLSHPRPQCQGQAKDTMSSADSPAHRPRTGNSIPGPWPGGCLLDCSVQVPCEAWRRGKPETREEEADKAHTAVERRETRLGVWPVDKDRMATGFGYLLLSSPAAF